MILKDDNMKPLVSIIVLATLVLSSGHSGGFVYGKQGIDEDQSIYLREKNNTNGIGERFQVHRTLEEKQSTVISKISSHIEKEDSLKEVKSEYELPLERRRIRRSDNGINKQLSDGEKVSRKKENTDELKEKQSAYNKRKGTSGDGGQQYEIHFAMLFLLQGITKYNRDKIRNFYLASNMLEAKNFDDVVFKYENSESQESKIFFIQQKHKDYPEKDDAKITLNRLFPDAIKKDHFALWHYFQSYLDVKKQFSEENSDHPIFGSNFEDCEFIIYTNADAHDEFKEDNAVNFRKTRVDKNPNIREYDVDEESFLYTEEGKHYYQLTLGENKKTDEKIINALMWVSDYMRLAKELVNYIFPEKEETEEIFNKEIVNKYQVALVDKVIDTEKGKFSKSFFVDDKGLSAKEKIFKKVFLDELKNRKEFSEMKEDKFIIPALLNKEIKWPYDLGNAGEEDPKPHLSSDRTSLDEVEGFLSQLKLFIGQPNEKRLADFIKTKIRSSYAIDSTEIERTFLEIKEKVRNWWKMEDRCEYLTEENRFIQQSAKYSIMFDVKKPIELFTGRKQELIDLHKAIQSSSDEPTVISQMTSISGMGGIGKSQLARKYIQQYSEIYDNNIIWINAENEDTLGDSFRRLAKNKLEIRTLDANGNEKDLYSVVESVYKFLSNRKSLFIFDNAEKYKTQGEDFGIDRFLMLTSAEFKDINRKFLITSRNQRWGKKKLIQLGIFTDNEAKEFIKKSLNIKDGQQENDVENLVKELQGFPLALQQAVAYIEVKVHESRNTRSKFDINNFLIKYKKKTKELLSFEFPEDSSDPYTKTTFTTWKITTDKIKENKKYGKQAKEILDLISYIAPDNIPVEIFLGTELISGDEEILASAVTLLEQYSMVSTGKEEGEISVHRLIQAVTRIELKGHEEDVIKRVYELLIKNFPHDRRQLEDIDKKRKLLPHLEALWKHFENWMDNKPEIKKRIEKDYLEILLSKISDVYYELGFPGKEKKLLEIVLKIQKEFNGPDHAEIAKTLNKLGLAYGKLGDRVKEKELLERSLMMLESYYGNDHFEVARTLNDLGLAYWRSDDTLKAKELLEKGLKIKETHYGPEHFESAKTLHNLGLAYGSLGDSVKEKELMEKALKIKERHYGPDHFEVAKTLHDLHEVYEKLEDPLKAKELLERALIIYKRHYGDDNFEVATTLENLGLTYGSLGNTEKEKEFLERALKIQERHYGPDHIEVAITLHNLGLAYGKLGSIEKEKDLLEKTLKIQERHYGHDHFEVARTLHNLGLAYGKLGNTEKKKELLEKALRIKERLYSPDHFEVPITLHNLGIAYGKLGSTEKEKDLLEKTLKIQERHYGHDHFEVARTLHNLGLAYGNLGSIEKQKDLLEKTLKIQERHYDPYHFEVARTLHNLGVAYGKLGNTGKEKNLLEKALIIKERHYGHDHFKVAITLHNLGLAYGKLGNTEKEKEFLERALQILERHYGPDHIEVARTLHNLGLAYGKLGSTEKEKYLLEKAFIIEEMHYGYDHIEVARTLGSLGLAYGKLGNTEKEKELLDKALRIKERLYSPNHFEVAITLHNLGIAYGKLGNTEKKKELLEKTLKIQERHYGPYHFEVARTLHNLGVAYGKLGNTEKEKNLLEKALIIKERYYGHDHFKVAITLHNLGVAYGKLGSTEKEKELLEKALKIQERQYGPDHFEVAITLSSLGLAYGKLGNTEKEKELLEKALKIQERHYGPDHFEVATTLCHLANAYGVSGNPIRQKDLLSRALPILQESNHHSAIEVKGLLDKFSRLHYVVRLGNFDMVKTLIEEGCNVLARNSHDTVLHQAVNTGNNDVLRLIFHKIIEMDPQNINIHINAQDNEGDTPLMWAAKTGKIDASNILLEYTHDLNIQNVDGETALHWAVKGGHEKIVQLLLDKGADPNIKDRHGRTPLDLTQEKLIEYPDKDNIQTIKSLLLSVTGEPKLEDEEQVSGSVSVEECLSGVSPGRRRKREAKIDECLYSWEDVDEMNVEKDNKRDISKVILDSEKFVSYIKYLPATKRHQLIELADHVKVTGGAKHIVHKLVGHKNVLNHLDRAGRVSHVIMQGMITKNVISDFLNRNYEGVAINIGFVAGGHGFAKLAKAVSSKGLELTSEGKLLIGSSLKAASPFLARGTSAFVVYDLVYQISEYKKGDHDALVGIIGDSIYLGIDVAEVGIEVGEVFGVLEGISSVTGPIGSTIGAVIFVGTDIFMAIKRVEKIDQIIHLERNERFIEGLHSFIGLQPEEHIQELINEKEVNNYLAKQGLEYLVNHNDIKHYVFPTGKWVVDSCGNVPNKTTECASGGLGGRCFKVHPDIRSSEECTTKFEVDLDNRVLLDRERSDIKWSRAHPDNPSGGQLLCSPQGEYTLAPNYGSYVCESAIGVTDLSADKNGNFTLISLGEGKDYAKGFIDSPNIFLVNNGIKQYHGGDKDDMFIMQGNGIKGYFYGEGGFNTLDLTLFAPDQEDIDVKLHTGRVEDYFRNNYFGMSEIIKLLGRREKADRIFVTCDSTVSDIKFIDGQGGSERLVDHINIFDNDCAYEMQIIVRPNTVIYNRALKGKFHYTIPIALGSAKIDFIHSAEELKVSNNFQFDYDAVDIKNVSAKIINVLNRTSHIIQLHLSPSSDKEFNITISGASNPSYRLGNDTEIKVGEKGNLYFLQISEESVEDIIKHYSVVAKRLDKTTFFIKSSRSNETVVIGSGNHVVIQNNPLGGSHLVGIGSENIYVIESRDKKLSLDRIPLPKIVIYHIVAGCSLDTIDLRTLVQLAVEYSNKDGFELKILKNLNDLLLKATVSGPELTSKNWAKKHEYFTVILKDGFHCYNKTHLILNNIPMKISCNSGHWSLKPLPLVFEKDKEIFVITNKDIEENNEVVIPKRAGNYTFLRNESNNLILTNAFDESISRNELCTVIFLKFYEKPKMETLSIRFANEEIVMRDHNLEIYNARSIDNVITAHFNQVYSDVLNHTTKEWLIP